MDNIRIEPDGQRPRVLVHGRACRNTTHPKCTLGPADASGATPSSSAAASEMNGIMYAVDIEALMKKANTPLGKCSRPTDYERWNVPSVTGTPRCVLGGCPGPGACALYRTTAGARSVEQAALGGPALACRVQE